MFKVLVLCVVMLLTSCSTSPDRPPQIITEYEYVYSFPPDSLFEIPHNVPDIDPEHSTQKDVSFWLSKRYERTLRLEQMLIELKAFYELTKQRAEEQSKEDEKSPVD